MTEEVIKQAELNNNTVSQQDKTPEQMMAERFRGYYPVVIDVETAGFNADTDALLEFAACTLKFTKEGTLVQDEKFCYQIAPFPDANIEDANIKFIGIDPFDPKRGAIDEKLALVPFFKKIAKIVKKNGCKRAILVGHNAAFDLKFMNAAIKRLNYKRSPFHPFSCIDTATLSALMLGQTVLSISCLTAGLDFDCVQAHGAAYDTDREADLFCYFINRFRELGGWPLPKDMQDAAIHAAQTITYSKPEANKGDNVKNENGEEIAYNAQPLDTQD